MAAAEEANPLAEFQRREGQLFDTGWQMVRANSPFCPRTVNSIGLLIHDAHNYAQADQVRQALSLAGDIGVQAVAEGSPAAEAGIIPNRTLFAIDTANVELTWKPTRPTVERTLQLENAMAESLEDGRIALSFNDRGGETYVTGEKVCAAKYRLTPGDEAYAGPDTVFSVSIFRPSASNAMSSPLPWRMNWRTSCSCWTIRAARKPRTGSGARRARASGWRTG